MTNPKSAPAARVSAANALLDIGYGKPPQHISGESDRTFVIRAPQPYATAEEWEASLGHQVDRGSSTSVRLLGQEEPPKPKLPPKWRILAKRTIWSPAPQGYEGFAITGTCLPPSV